MFFMLPGIMIPEDMVIQVLKAFEVTGESVIKPKFLFGSYIIKP